MVIFSSFLCSYIGSTPLIWTASNRDAKVVKIRLGQNSNKPNRRETPTRTSLYWVALIGHEAGVDLFLGRDSVDYNQLCTMLNWAASEGCEWVVKMLLGLGDVNSNERDSYGLTLLCSATMEGYEGVMKVLFGWNEVDSKQLFGASQTPLSFLCSLLNFLFLCYLLCFALFFCFYVI